MLRRHSPDERFPPFFTRPKYLELRFLVLVFCYIMTLPDEEQQQGFVAVANPKHPVLRCLDKIENNC